MRTKLAIPVLFIVAAIYEALLGAAFLFASGALFAAGISKELVVQRLHPTVFFVRQRLKLVMTSVRWQMSAPLGEKPAKPLDLPVRHLDDLFDR